MDKIVNNKMKAVGIIAEYNPFHNGHRYHLEQSLEMTGADVCVAVMSGYFTQRGEAALLDKWTRAEIAIKNGVNLVVEMPTIFACNSAGYFAESGVRILEELGVEYISFGSESGNIKQLSLFSRAIKDNEEIIENAVKSAVKRGLSYPRARHEAIELLSGLIAAEKESNGLGVNGLELEIGEILENPNNILALEYLKHIEKARPITVKRCGAGYYDDEAASGIGSATAVRKCLKSGQDISQMVSPITREIIERNRDRLLFSDESEKMFDILREIILTTSADDLNKIFGASEGLGNAMKNGVRYRKSYAEMVDELKSKRYTQTRILRLLTNTLLNVTEAKVKSAKNYIRVLAFDERGSAYLKQVKKCGICALPIITNINKDLENCPDEAATLQTDILAADIYNLAAGLDLYENSEFVRKPVKL